MKAVNLPKSLFENRQTLEIINKISENQSCGVSGLAGSSYAFLAASLSENTNQPILWIAENKEEAAYCFNDMERLLPGREVLFYPASYRRPYQIEQIDNANIMMRAEVLKKITATSKACIISYPDALFEQVLTRKELKKKTLALSLGMEVSIDFINEVLFEYEFQRVDFVTQPGEFSVRGGILDIFSFDAEVPYRLEFFGDEIDRINRFDVLSQRSTEACKKVAILANVEQKISSEERQPLWSFLPKNTLFLHHGISDISTVLDGMYRQAVHREGEKTLKRSAPEILYCQGSRFEEEMTHRIQIDFSGHSKFDHRFQYSCSPQPTFQRNFERIRAHLIENDKKGIQNHIFCSNDQQAIRLARIFEEAEVPHRLYVMPLYRGFLDTTHQNACYTDHEFFERYHKFRLKNGYAKKQAISLKAFNQLQVGDYVTHIDHGIGKFGGLQHIEVEGKKQEAIKLIYGERDILYVSIHSLHKIAKYNGKEGTAPRLFKLGSAAWNKLKQKTKKKVKEIAFNLIEVYAKRKLKKGFQYHPDSYLQHELEASFIYEDTPDQRKATEAVKKDMESEQPMDRLVCGDVGFGKTEVAIRAAFKAVDNHKQVAVLVPTTILAYQHFNTFTKRLKDFPVRVDYINRFRTSKEQKQILEGTTSGAIDILIGTHQLVSKHTQFKNLGLLIVDEEQKFGVGVKEKLRSLKANVDVLTLTATPIPRTLQFSLMAARDLSIINTPPPNRHPIDSQVIGFSEEQIRDAISYELQRGGQVFFVHNRVEHLAEFSGMIQRLVPDAKIARAHGQMEGRKLETTMRDFIEGKYDVLLATTIIENGLDVPNANTILINNAHQFGLSDLHQMRGRVGRSNKKAFCYFISAPLSNLTDEARKRMRALSEHTALGAGFQIAMRDLEIRGAGDLLGGEQTGFINDIGFETYQKILKEAVDELKESEFKSLFQNEAPTKKEVQIDTDLALLFPDSYVNNVKERLVCYKDLGEVKDEESLKEFIAQMKDRFGPLPNSSVSLINSVRLKWLCADLHIEKAVLKKNKLICYFDANAQSDFYQSDAFREMLLKVQTHPLKGTLKEKKKGEHNRLMLVFENIKTIEKALDCLAHLQ